MSTRESRGAAGSGNIRQRSDGRWEGRYTVGIDPGTGKQVQKSIYGKTQKEVRERLRKITSEIDDGSYLEPSRCRVGQWLDIWLNEYTDNVKPYTKYSYRITIQNHLKPAFGYVRLSELNTVMIQAFINSLVRSKEEGGKGLSPKTAINIHGVLHRALKQAANIGLIRSNPADACIRPRGERQPIHPLEDEEVGLFLNAVKGHRFEALYLVDLFTGMRQGETVVLLSKGEIDSKKVRVEFSLEDMDMSGFQKGATYEQIKAYVLEKFELKVSSLYISQIKRKCGLDVGQNYNLSKKENAKVPKCPPEKEAAIMDALKYFQMIM